MQIVSEYLRLLFNQRIQVVMCLLLQGAPNLEGLIGFCLALIRLSLVFLLYIYIIFICTLRGLMTD